MGKPDDALLDTMMAHRSGTTSPLGKLTERLEALRIEDVVKARLELQAAELGIPCAEYRRLIYRLVTFGESAVRSMHSEHIDRVVEKLRVGGLAVAK